MSETESGRPDPEPWLIESSALSTLVFGTVGIVDAGLEIGDPGPVTVVAAAIVIGVGSLAVGLLGRFVDLPFPRQWALTAAALLGFGAVVANGLLAASSVWLTDGPEELLTVTALTAAFILAVLGGLLALGWLLAPR
ncbi:MAG: hypothetical protein J07HX64_01398 [halophilic archaeon J07HX64]|jgi:hypothetical protein|nr:MAG: hypothetical protein J07HX64_01398 [halophilic archaeon J07HX64]